MELWVARYIIGFILTLIVMVVIVIKNNITPDDIKKNYRGVVYMLPAVIIGVWWAIETLTK